MLLSSVLVFSCFAVFGVMTACPEIVTRKEWGARPPKASQTMSTPVAHVFIHHTAGSSCSSKAECMRVVKQTQTFHIDGKKWGDIGYSFLVGGDGRIYEGRGWTKVGAHTFGYNSKALGISFMGDFQKAIPSDKMLNAARSLIDCGVIKGYITRGRQIHGHRDAKCTACPGQFLYDAIKKWVGFKGGKLPGYKC